MFHVYYNDRLCECSPFRMTLGLSSSLLQVLDRVAGDRELVPVHEGDHPGVLGLLPGAVSLNGQISVCALSLAADKHNHA